jgi:dsRNA-specific ribonuclease
MEDDSIPDSLKLRYLSKQIDYINTKINIIEGQINLLMAATTNTEYEPNYEEAANNVPEPMKQNPVANLNNYCQHYFNIMPEYKYVPQTNGQHQIEVWFGKHKLSDNTDKQKQKAKVMAAIKALAVLNIHKDNLKTIYQQAI